MRKHIDKVDSFVLAHSSTSNKISTYFFKLKCKKTRKVKWAEAKGRREKIEGVGKKKTKKNVLKYEPN